MANSVYPAKDAAMAEPIIGDGIIVADNDALIRDLLRSMLVHEGYSVFLATNGAEALAYAHRLQAQLVVLDLGMPRLNGLCACEAMRRLPGYAGIPIVILTVFDGWDTREAAHRVGATRFFTKPFRSDEFMRELLSLIGERANAQWPSSGQAWTRHQEPAPAYDVSPELARGAKVLNIYRR